MFFFFFFRALLFLRAWPGVEKTPEGLGGCKRSGGPNARLFASPGAARDPVRLARAFSRWRWRVCGPPLADEPGRRGPPVRGPSVNGARLLQGTPGL